MSTSGITTYQLSRDDIINAALRKLGVIADGQTASSDNIANAIVALNGLVARFRSKGMPLWARTQYSFTPISGQAQYPIGLGKPFNTPYPLHVLQAYRQDSTNTTKIYMEVIPNFNFNLYPTTSGGIPIQLNYQPLVNYGLINVWPVPDNTAVNSVITIVYQRPFEYFNSSTDTMDFPEEWYLAIIYHLAVLLAPEWGVPLDDRRGLIAEANAYLEEALENGYEDGSLFLQPDNRKK